MLERGYRRELGLLRAFRWKLQQFSISAAAELQNRNSVVVTARRYSIARMLHIKRLTKLFERLGEGADRGESPSWVAPFFVAKLCKSGARIQVALRAKLLAGAYSKNTISTHTGQMTQFVNFCETMGYSLGDETAVVSWIFHSRETLYRRKNTLVAKLQAYKWCHAVAWRLGEVDSSRGSVMGLLERCIARLADDRTPKLAVTKAQLERMVTSLEGVVPLRLFKELRAWWCISYAAFLRCSETAQIRWKDVEVERSDTGALKSVTVSLSVRDRIVFKTTTESIKLRLLRAPEDRKAICPVLTLQSWLRIAGGDQNSSGTVFSTDCGVARKKFQEIAVWVLGGEPGQYGLHSLRAGAATDAEVDGKQLSEIMFQGRWKSATVLQYMRNGERRAQELGLHVRDLRDVRVIQG